MVAYTAYLEAGASSANIKATPANGKGSDCSSLAGEALTEGVWET